MSSADTAAGGGPPVEGVFDGDDGEPLLRLQERRPGEQRKVGRHGTDGTNTGRVWDRRRSGDHEENLAPACDPLAEGTRPVEAVENRRRVGRHHHGLLQHRTQHPAVQVVSGVPQVDEVVRQFANGPTENVERGRRVRSQPLDVIDLLPDQAVMLYLGEEGAKEARRRPPCLLLADLPTPLLLVDQLLLRLVDVAEPGQDFSQDDQVIGVARDQPAALGHPVQRLLR